jgi:spore coat protein U-like protein
VLSPSLAHAAVCTVHVGDLDFGAVDAIGNTPATTTASIDISCDAIGDGTGQQQQLGLWPHPPAAGRPRPLHRHGGGDDQL